MFNKPALIGVIFSVLGQGRVLQFLSILLVLLNPLPADPTPYPLLDGRVYQDTSLLTDISDKPAPTIPDPRCQTQDIKTLTNQLLRDLPAYANRTSQRARRLSRSVDLYTYVLVAGQPEFEPLTTEPGVYQPKSPQAESDDVQQVFFTTLERQYLSDRAVELQGFHWAFFTKTEDGWRLATMFTRIGDAEGGMLFDHATQTQSDHRTGKRYPTPPEETSDGIIAQAIETWLRDCRARDAR